MSELVNPEDFIKTRKRKLYKFALFSNSTLCFEYSDWQKTDTIDTVELGAGNAHFLVELATLHPNVQYAGVDVKADRLQSGARLAESRGLTNIKFIRARADQIEDLFITKSVKTIWLTFSDPFPRKGNAGRRLTHPTYLAKYASILSEGGELLIKHDNLDFFCWSLEQLVASRWSIRELSFDLHESELHEDYKILTAYEERWLSQGLTTQFVAAHLPRN